MSTSSKKRPDQHRIDTAGIALFRDALPHTSAVDFVFDTSESDYGIDGEIQVFKNNKHTGEFYKVQIKSKQKAKRIEKGKYISLSLDIGSAYFLTSQAKTPTALIVPDLDSGKVFWHPVQTDSALRTTVENSLGQKSITVRINVDNEVRKDHYEGLHAYFKDAHTKLSQKAVLEDKMSTTLNTGLGFLSEIEQQTLKLDGFDPYTRPSSANPTPGTMFSVSHGPNRTVDYVPSSDYRPELAPEIKISAKFDTKTSKGSKRAEAFRRLVEKGEGSIELTDENLEVFKTISGSDIIGDAALAKGIKVTLSSAPAKRRHLIFISNGEQDIVNEVYSWVESDGIHIESLDGQRIKLAVVIDPTPGTNANFNIKLNSETFSSPTQELRYVNFLRSLEEVDMGITDTDGFKIKMFGGAFNKGSKVIPDERYNFIKALSEIEQASGVPIPYPVPSDLGKEDINNVYWVHRLLTRGSLKQSMSFSFVLKKNYRPDELEEGGAFMLTQDPPEIYLFKKPYVLNGFKQAIKGIISGLSSEKIDDTQTRYKARLQEAEVSIEKKPKEDGSPQSATSE
ncbi:DUF4365 domain-containing protein [Candidatus Saccharibacteria bacterium]|nr:DUF4365 domain-containing protein [Candidatus Saccharibacteria bacterium]